jgi:DNA-binding NarL/FixJ family response regulator
MAKARVLITDDHALVAEGLARILSAEYEVVGISSNGRELLADAIRLNPDVVCLDIAMPELNGIEAAMQLARIAPRIKIVFVTQQIDLQYLRAAFRAGGRGYVAKQSASQEMLNALRKVLAGLHYISPLMAKKWPNLVHELQRNPTKFFTDALTPRQREVLQLVAEGKTVREISTALKISPKTVEFHKNGLMNELGLRTTADLTRYALANHIIAA